MVTSTPRQLPQPITSLILGILADHVPRVSADVRSATIKILGGFPVTGSNSLATVTVRFFATVREITGAKSIEIEASDIKDLLNKLGQTYGKTFTNAVIDPGSGQLKRFYSCMVNGKRIELIEGYQTKLKDKDVVALFPPVGGG
jgi:molybdopterin synthase sulfur carrier subunit